MKTKTNVKIYRPKALIDGSLIDKEPFTKWVAVPDKYADRPICVIYGDMQMDIKDWRKEAQFFKRFRDKFWEVGSNRRQFYTLGYIKWRPDR